MTEAIFTPEQLAEVKAYAWPSYVWAAICVPVSLAIYLLMIRFVVPRLYAGAGRAADSLSVRLAWARRVRGIRAGAATLERLWGGAGWGHALLFALSYLLTFELVSLPMSLYFSYVLERAHGMSNYTPLSYAWDLFKAEATAAVALAALTLGMYGLARRLKWWWLVLGIVASVAMVGSGLLDPYRARLYFDETPLPQGAVRSDVEAVLRKAKVEFSDIVVLNTSRTSKKVDVACAGEGPTRRVVISDSFLQQFSERELLVAVAHEAGHVRQGNRLGLVASGAALIAFLFLVDRIFRWAAQRHWLGIDRYADIRTLPIISVVFYALTSLTGPVASAYSRQRERDADRFALEVTQDPEALETLLVRAARINKMDPDPPRWVVWAGMSHPPLGERIAWAEEMKKAAGR